MTTAQITRRDLLRRGAAGAAVGTAALAVPAIALAGGGAKNVQVAEIYQLQAAFHRAKTTADLDLMMSLWAPDATLDNQGDANSPYVGTDQLRGFWSRSGSFTHRRFSLVPSFKTQIEVHGNEAWMYFECHDIGDYDLATRFFAVDAFPAGTVKNVGGSWVFWSMTAGKTFPHTFDRYFP